MTGLQQIHWTARRYQIPTNEEAPYQSVWLHMPNGNLVYISAKRHGQYSVMVQPEGNAKANVDLWQTKTLDLASIITCLEKSGTRRHA